MLTIGTRMRRSAVTALVAVGAALASTGTAQAAYTDCPSNRFCIWDNANATGHWAYFSEGTSDLSSSSVFGGILNDKTSYVYNRTGETWCVYEHKNRGGRAVRIGSGARTAMTFYVDGFYWNDKISSVRPIMYIRPPLSSVGYYTC